MQVKLVELVWAAPKDGHWHTIPELAERVPGTQSELVEVVNFLAEYGFIESSSKRTGRFRAITSTPPNEIADKLRSIALELKVA